MDQHIWYEHPLTQAVSLWRHRVVIHSWPWWRCWTAKDGSSFRFSWFPPGENDKICHSAAGRNCEELALQQMLCFRRTLWILVGKDVVRRWWHHFRWWLLQGEWSSKKGCYFGAKNELFGICFVVQKFGSCAVPFGMDTAMEDLHVRSSARTSQPFAASRPRGVRLSGWRMKTCSAGLQLGAASALDRNPPWLSPRKPMAVGYLSSGFDD